MLCVPLEKEEGIFLLSSQDFRASGPPLGPGVWLSVRLPPPPSLESGCELQGSGHLVLADGLWLTCPTHAQVSLSGSMTLAGPGGSPRTCVQFMPLRMAPVWEPEGEEREAQVGVRNPGERGQSPSGPWIALTVASSSLRGITGTGLKTETESAPALRHIDRPWRCRGQGRSRTGRVWLSAGR